MSVSKFDAGAYSQGDVMRRLRLLERDVSLLRTARSLEAASIGAGGLRIRGGVLTIQDQAGDDMFRAGGTPGEVFIRDDVLGPLVLQIFGAGIHNAPTITTGIAEGTTSTTFTDLVTFGPVVSNVQVSSAGRAMVLLGGALVANASQAPVMGFSITGATNRTATDLGGVLAILAPPGGVMALTGTATMIVEGLNAGVHQFTAKYKSDAGGSVGFNQRSLAVIPF